MATPVPTPMLDINKCEWLKDIKKEKGSLASFMACVEESIIRRGIIRSLRKD